MHPSRSLKDSTKSCRQRHPSARTSMCNSPRPCFLTWLVVLDSSTATMLSTGQVPPPTMKKMKVSGKKPRRRGLQLSLSRRDRRTSSPAFLLGRSSQEGSSGTKASISCPSWNMTQIWRMYSRNSHLELLYTDPLSLDIIKSWFHLMDEDGWIAREQILGMEARSKVPPEFTVQYPHYANPPTLFMALEAFMDKAKSNKSVQSESFCNKDVNTGLRTAILQNPELADAYLRSFYPLMKKHYFWYRNTQRGDIKSYDREAFSTKEAYRWRGRSQQHILTSGIDDYPRAQPPHPGELHVDLISWMGMMTRTLRRIAETLGETDDVEEFAMYENAISRNIDDLHWDEKEQTFCDATIDEFEESVHVCHKGYISIFPFLTGMLGRDSPHLKPILDLIRDPEELWSDFGIRSLSKKDKFYGTDENYWRSPIWVPINYLVVRNLYVSDILIQDYPLFPTDLSFPHRIWPMPPALTRNRPGRCTRSCGRTWLRMFSGSGRRLALPGNSTTRKQVTGSGHSTLPAGPVWW